MPHVEGCTPGLAEDTGSPLLGAHPSRVLQLDTHLPGACQRVHEPFNPCPVASSACTVKK